MLTIYISRKRAASVSTVASSKSFNPNFLDPAIFIDLIVPFNSWYSDEVQSVPPKCIKKAVPGSPEFASQASVVTMFVFFLFLYELN